MKATAELAPVVFAFDIEEFSNVLKLSGCDVAVKSISICKCQVIFTFYSGATMQQWIFLFPVLLLWCEETKLIKESN